MHIRRFRFVAAVLACAIAAAVPAAPAGAHRHRHHQHKRRHAQATRPSPPPRPVTFSGSCDLSGSVDFQPPLTNTPQDVEQRAELSGPCSGTLVDAAGRSHQLNGAATGYHGVEQASGASCLAGVATGTVVLSFPYGDITTRFTERRLVATPVIELDGRSSGSAWGVAYPQSNQDPMSAVQQCGSTGMKTFAVDAHMQTTPSISG